MRRQGLFVLLWKNHFHVDHLGYETDENLIQYYEELADRPYYRGWWDYVSQNQIKWKGGYVYGGGYMPEMGQTEKLIRLTMFAKDIMENWPDGGVEGDELQELAVKHKLLTPVEVYESCGENCACADYGNFPVTCYKRTELIT